MNGSKRIYALDTNVLLHDPTSLFRFEEHDIFLPMIVLEELDAHKKGMTEVARNGRQTSRTLDALAAARGADMAQGLKLDTTSHTAGCLGFLNLTLVHLGQDPNGVIRVTEHPEVIATNVRKFL